MDINLSYVFLLALAGLLALFALLCFLKGRLGKGFWSVLGEALRYLCLQGLVSLVFLLCYAFFIKNGFSPSLSDMGVAFIPLAIGIHWAAWRLGALSPSPTRLWLPFAYSVFLLYKFFTAGGGVSFFGYVVFNPAFAFIGSLLADSPLKPFGAISALLPMLCALIGRGISLRRNN